jgi:hypothetical protein
MSIDKAIKSILNDSTGSRVGDRDFLPTKKVELLADNVRNALHNQWDAAGRDGAKIYLKLDEEDGSSIFLTGFDGHNKYVGYDSTGFGYIEPSRIESGKPDEKWNSEITLGHVRNNLDEMDRTQVTDLVSRLKKCLTKRSKDRRHSEVKNFVKRFQKACNTDKVEVKTEEKGEDVASDRLGSKKKPDKKGEYSWHTKGNYAVPVKEDFSNALSSFKSAAKTAVGLARKALKPEEGPGKEPHAIIHIAPNKVNRSERKLRNLTRTEEKDCCNTTPREKELEQKALTRGKLALKSKFASPQKPR